MKSALALLLAAQPVLAADLPSWPADKEGRLAALAVVETLNAEILAGRSATLVLEKWCLDHGLSGGAEAKIIAQAVKGADKPITAEQRQRLQISADEPVRFRHVRLTCGTNTLSEADNWYVPSRLTAEMNRQLDETDTPFGKVVRGLEPYRQTFFATLLWRPLPEGWETRPLPDSAGSRLDMPDALFEHKAVLFGKDHLPFSEVDEVYQRHLLDFPPPR
ncbi:MAG TPA: hypothetical protein VKP60_10155 [Magnetospirillaceae bacterium]|nr:hypothetical protein [Magnetospirillaceae bacterium]